MKKTDNRPTFATKLKAAIKSKGTFETAADISGIPKATIYGWASGKSIPNALDFMKLVASLETVSPADIMPEIYREFFKIDSDENIDVPVYDAHLSAGDGAINTRAEILRHIPFKTDYIREITGRVDISSLALLEVRGDSMHPTIEDRDLVMVDQNDRSLRDGVFAFVMMGEARVKRFQTRINGLDILSDNKESYAPETLPLDQIDDVEIIGRIIWRMGRL